MKPIETERLILRNFREDDFEDLYEYLSDGRVTEFEPYDVMSEEQVRKDLAHRMKSDEMIAVERKEDGKLLGNVYFGKRDFSSREIGYVFNQKYWRKGYAKEACLGVIETARRDGIHRVYAECDPLNENSWRLLESLGMKREGYFLKNVYFNTDQDGNPIWKDTYVYAVLLDEE